METIDLLKLSTEQLEAALKEKKDAEKKQAQQRRDAYEGIRAELLFRMQNKTEEVCQIVKDFFKMCTDESNAFRDVLKEYGQLKSEGQLSFTIRDEKFKWEIKNNKVKKFDERADIAAARLIDFLKKWIKNQKDGVDNPMYQLCMTLLGRNQYGDLDYKSISKLYELESRFDDPEYSEIMQLFKESNIVEANAINFYFYKRDENEVWRKLEPSFNKL